MYSITRLAPAKINLYLNVLSRRDDGYHNIESIMQTVSLADTVTVHRHDAQFTGQKLIRITCDNNSVPCDKRNIAYRCAERFFAAFGIKEYYINIDIDKRIPVCAGLAGGSSDGAAAVIILRDLYGIEADDDTLCSLCAPLGADIPFCITGGCCLCTGTGTSVQPLEVPPSDYYVLIAISGAGVSARDAYALIDSSVKSVPAVHYSEVLSSIASGGTPRVLYNSFEDVILPMHKEAAVLKSRMTVLGASASLMSGSGPAVFGLFESEERCLSAKDTLCSEGIMSFACKPLSH